MNKKEYRKKYYLEHRDRILKLNKEYRKKNKKKIKELVKKWFLEHKEWRREYMRNWYYKNKYKLNRKRLALYHIKKGNIEKANAILRELEE